MPQTDKYWRNVKQVHVVFALSSVAMFVTTIWMMAADHSNEWSGYQRTWEDVQAASIRQSESRIRNSDEYKQNKAEIEESLDAAAMDIDQHEADLQAIREELRPADLAADLAGRAVRTQRAVRDKARADYDLAVRDDKPAPELRELKAIFDAEQAKVDELELELQQSETVQSAVQRRLNELTAQRATAQAELNRLNTDLDRLNATLTKIEPENKFSRIKRTMMEWPIINGFNSHLKINQDWLPNLKIKLGMTETARFDRCRTCHLAVDRVEIGARGMQAAFPLGHPQSGSVEDWVRENRFPHPYATHSRPELYATASSPHPVSRFGCTICHEGQGSGTSFSTAAHYPNDPHESLEWEEKYDFAKNHFWQFPMYPERLREASCLKCHHNVVELGAHPEFGASAPQVHRGWQLVKSYGCFGCHEIHGYESGRPIGPDLRLEPQTPEEEARYAGDPALIAGQLRKVGPSLRHIAAKSTPEWVAYWTQEPKRFRPTTRMPQFFDLTNQQDAHAAILQPVELKAVAAYLFGRSEPLDQMEPKPGYQPDPERGRELFSHRGCLACHSHEAFPGVKSDFAPELSKVHAKLRPGQDGFRWLYTWLRDPERYHARTRMPNLYLEAYSEGETEIDPAADIAAFLTQKGPVDYPEINSEPYLGLSVDDNFDGQEAQRLGLPEPRGVRVAEVMPISPATRATRREETDSGMREVPWRLNVDDVLFRFGEVELSSGEQLDELVRQNRPGTEVSLAVWRGGSEWDVNVVIEDPLDDLVRLYLSKVLTNPQSEETLTMRKYPFDRTAIKGDEIELVPPAGQDSFSEQEWNRIKLNYVGRRTITRYGCFGCHDIPGFETVRPIGTTLQDWGRKDLTKLAPEHILEYLHHHGEPDGSSTHERMVEATRKRLAGGVEAGEFASEEEEEREMRAAFFYEDLVHHGRAGFFWQKMRQPRSYDYKKTETKGYDERLRMPRFPFDDEEIEAIATFVLGLVAEPPDASYLYQPEGPAKARIEGERLLEKYNCASCHMLELHEIQYGVDVDQVTATPVAPSDHPEGLDLLFQLKPPRKGETGETAHIEVDGEQESVPVVSFHGLPFGRPDPEEPPEFQEYSYDLWETLDVGGKRLLPGSLVLVPAANLVDEKPPRGGTYAEWLVEDLMQKKTEGNRRMAWQMVPPPLFQEGMKVQTPWLFRFLREPERLRQITVLRMPRFNMSAEEAQAFADYFAAVDGVSYPYQQIPQRDPGYVQAMNEAAGPLLEPEDGGYLAESWRLLNAPLCIKCHSLGGRQFQVSDPKTDIRGPNLDLASDRLRPDWTLLWLYKPQWITPYTSMPQPLPRGQGQFTDLLGGNAGLQTIAVRDALMNYNRLMESQGKTIYEPKAARTAAAGGN